MEICIIRWFCHVQLGVANAEAVAGVKGNAMIQGRLGDAETEDRADKVSTRGLSVAETVYQISSDFSFNEIDEKLQNSMRLHIYITKHNTS